MNRTVTPRDRLLAILPKYEQKATGRRRTDPIKVFEGILFVLKTGCRWTDIDKYKYASFQTCHRYFQQSVQDGTLERALNVLVDGCEKVGKFDFSESFVDGTYVRSKKRAIQRADATQETATD